MPPVMTDRRGPLSDRVPARGGPWRRTPPPGGRRAGPGRAPAPGASRPRRSAAAPSARGAEATGRGAAPAVGARRPAGPARLHLAPGAPRRRAPRAPDRVGPVPADRAARLQRRRRRRGGDLAGRHAVLPGPDRRGPRPGRAVPGPDDAAVRDRGAADRAVPRPVQPRPPLGDRRDDGAPRVPVLGAGRRGRRPSRRWLFPAALGVLVASKAYGVTRAAAVPRLLPDGPHPGQGQRPDLAGRRRRRRGLGAAGRRWPSTFGPEWSLRYAFVLFVLATILAIRLPARVDSDAGRGPGRRCTGERPARRNAAGRGCGSRARWPSRCGPTAGRAGCSGFLTMFMAFLLREQPDRRLARPRCCSAIVIGAAGLGNTIGIALGSLLKQRQPARSPWCSRCWPTPRWSLLAALFYGAADRWPCSGLTAGLAQSLAKLSLDSTIQRDVPERVQHQRLRPLRHHAPAGLGDRRLRRHRAAARAPRLGLGVAAVVLVAWSVVRAGQLPGRSDARRDGGRRRPPTDRRHGRRAGLRARARRRARAAAWRSASAVRAVGVPAVAVGLADAVEQPDQVLDDRRPSPRASCAARATGCARPRRARRGPAPGAPGRRGGPGRCRTPRGCRP